MAADCPMHQYQDSLSGPWCSPSHSHRLHFPLSWSMALDSAKPACSVTSVSDSSFFLWPLHRQAKTMQCSGPGPFSTLELFKSSFQIEPSLSAISPATCLPVFSRLPCLFSVLQRSQAGARGSGLSQVCPSMLGRLWFWHRSCG